MMVANNFTGFQRGYSLIELLVALLIGTALTLGISTAYSSISGVVSSNKNLENAQEVLRYSVEVFSRSLKQTAQDPSISGDVLTVEQDANNIACDGSIPTTAFQEIFTIDDNNLTCDIGTGAKIILTGIESLSFSQSSKLVSINVQPQTINGESGVATAIMQIDIALSEIILVNAMK